MFGEANEAKMISWCTSRTVHDPGTNKERKIEDESSKVNEISTPKFFIAGSWGALFFNQSVRKCLFVFRHYARLQHTCFNIKPFKDPAPSLKNGTQKYP